MCEFNVKTATDMILSVAGGGCGGLLCLSVAVGSWGRMGGPRSVASRWVLCWYITEQPRQPRSKLIFLIFFDPGNPGNPDIFQLFFNAKQV